MTEQNILEQFPILSELPGDKLRQVYAHFKTAPQWLLEHISVVRFPPDTIFIREGQPACDVYVVASGTVKAVEYRVLGVQYDFIQFTKVYALGGKIANLGLISAEPTENYVQLPMESTQWSDSFTAEDYRALVAAMFDGTIEVSNDISAMPQTQIAVEVHPNIKG